MVEKDKNGNWYDKLIDIKEKIAKFVKLVVSKSDVYSYYIPISKGLVA